MSHIYRKIDLEIYKIISYEIKNLPHWEIQSVLDFFFKKPTEYVISEWINSAVNLKANKLS